MRKRLPRSHNRAPPVRSLPLGRLAGNLLGRANTMTATTPGEVPLHDQFHVLAGGGEMGRLLRACDWTRTSLGAPETWPRSLKTAIRIMLTSRQPIWIGWGEDLVFFYNDAYRSIVGGKHPWALGRPTREVWREIWPDIGPMLATALRGDEGTYVEEQLLVMERNGYPEETYYTFSYSPIPDDHGRPGGIICANTDDTQRVIGERQLALLRELAARTADARTWEEACARSAEALATNPRDLAFALVCVEPERGAAPVHFGAAPPALAAFVAPHVADVLARHAPSLVDLDGAGVALPQGAWDRPPRQAALLPIAQGGETGRAGVLVVGLNPCRLYDEAYAAFLGLAAGQIASAIANADAYEEERRRAEALAELDKAKTAFFSNVSHEFRTPLTLMLGPLEELLSEGAGLDPPLAERARVAHRNGLRLLKLVNTLLDFSRIEAGRVVATFEPTDLAAYTAALASNFRSATEKAGLALRVDCAPLGEPVHIDRDMWEKVVLNLLSNAFKFTLEGEIAVAVRREGERAVLTVRDTGIGIPQAEQAHVFKRFHRIGGTRGRTFEGSGIGLALVHELVSLHGGTIAFASEENRGTEFTVALRFGTAHLPAERVRSERTAESPTGRALAYVEEALRWLPEAAQGETIDADALPLAAPPSSGEARAHVLIADDNADMREYVCRLLQARHDCELAADGQAAIEAIRRRRPDLVLTGIMMPRLDGFGLIREIRSDPALRDLPVIVLSARAGEEARVEGLNAGADDYLAKPLSARELIARVDGALALSRTRREMGEALREQARTLEVLNRVGRAVAAELDLARAVQVVTDAATELTGAAFGSFFYNVVDAAGERYTLYALSGVPREAFSKFPMPRNTAVFAPTFNGEGVVRAHDILADPRYGRSAPHYGMPPGHLPVRSYLAAPVVSRSGEVLGGLFLGHPEPGVFTDTAEQLLVGIAAQAAIAIDNARLYQAAQAEIAERRRTEAALRESEERQQMLNQQLEAMVAERTAELAAANEQLREEARERATIEQALRQAQKMEAVGKLTGGVAHDFNNLLQVIGGNLQLLARDLAGREKAEERLRNALAGVARGSKLAAQLLAFGRRQPLSPKVVNLGRFVRGTDDLLRRALGDGIEVETIVSGGLWNVLVDPSQVENALLNLAINARDAMAGHGKLTIEAGNAVLDDAYAALNPDVRAGQYVMLAVSDTGCGMTADVIEHAFEPFFTTKPEGQGTGLGLSMVYGFVKQSDGHIGIYSEPGHGTTVRLYLPRVHEPEDVSVEIDAGPVVGGNETVLVVEDDEDVRETVVEIVADLGYRVLKARDAQSALAIVDSGVPIDLLFTDVVMPGPLRSTDLARKARERLPDVAILFTSGYTDNAIVHGGRLDAGIELLSKPYSREALARKLRHVLRNGQQTALKPAAAPYARDPVPASARWRVLFVDDESLIRASTADLLRDLGHDVLTAASGTEALALLACEPVDVLIADIRLPDISGYELVAEATRRLPGLRVVFASGADVAGASPKAVVLRKPYRMNDLADALKKAMAAPPCAPRAP